MQTKAYRASRPVCVRNPFGWRLAVDPIKPWLRCLPDFFCFPGRIGHHLQDALDKIVFAERLA